MIVYSHARLGFIFFVFVRSWCSVQMWFAKDNGKTSRMSLLWWLLSQTFIEEHKSHLVTNVKGGKWKKEEEDGFLSIAHFWTRDVNPHPLCGRWTHPLYDCLHNCMQKLSNQTFMLDSNHHNYDSTKLTMWSFCVRVLMFSWGETWEKS